MSPQKACIELDIHLFQFVWKTVKNLFACMIDIFISWDVVTDGAVAVSLFLTSIFVVA
jgi:hypothetical protein